MMVNGVFYVMEMRFLMFGSLMLTVGEMGPVEIEWLVACIMGFVGWAGPECMEKPVGAILGLSADSYLQGI